MIQKINEIQRVIQPKLISNAKQTQNEEEMRRKWIKRGKRPTSSSPVAAFFLRAPPLQSVLLQDPCTSLNLSFLFLLGKPPPTLLFLHQPAWLLYHQHGPCHAHAADFSGEKGAPLISEGNAKEEKNHSLPGPPTKGVYSFIFNKSFDSILIVLNFRGSYLLVLLLKRIYWKQIKKSEFDFYL